MKWIPATNPTWFSGNDNLEGTHTVGIEGDDDREWAIGFNSTTSPNFLFASGDFKNWLMTNDAFLNKDNAGTPTPYTTGNLKSFNVLQSSQNSQAYSHEFIFDARKEMPVLRF